MLFVEPRRDSRTRAQMASAKDAAEIVAYSANPAYNIGIEEGTL